MSMTDNNESAVLYSKTFEVRWADCDANNHMRHSAYADMAAHTRVNFLASIGLTDQWLKENQLGPVLFKETTEYYSEVFINEILTVTVEPYLSSGSKKTFTMQSKLYKANGELAARVMIHNALIDLKLRKVVELPGKVLESPIYYAGEKAEQ